MENTLRERNSQIEELIRNYERLNDETQDMIRGYVEHLTKSPKNCRLILIKTGQKGGTI